MCRGFIFKNKNIFVHKMNILIRVCEITSEWGDFMRNVNVFVAFSQRKTALNVAKIVVANGMHVACVTTGLTELRKHIHAYNNGIIVCGYQFKDDYVVDFFEDVPETMSIVLIGNRAQLEACNNERVFKLAVPLQRVDLVCSLNMIASMWDCMAAANQRNPKEEKIINRAKDLLIERYSMSEEQAHRYMQKKSMDTGVKLVDIAKIVLTD